MEKHTEDQMETSLASSTQEQLPSQKEGDVEKAMADDCSSANQTDKISPDNSSSDGVDVPKGRPMSPGTLALMCDEPDTMFMTAASPIGPMAHACNTSSQFPYGQGMTEVYAEQERIVLTKFRDFLNRVITMGEINGKLTFSSPLVIILLMETSIKSFSVIIGALVKRPTTFRFWQLTS